MMAAPTLTAVDESRGQVARRRREALGIARERLATEAHVSVKTIKSYEEDARENMPSGRRIEEALDRLEAADGPGTRHRRASDTPERRAIDAVIEGAEGEQVQIRFLGDGTRAIFIVPKSGQMPTDDDLEKLLRDVRGDDE